MFTEYLPDQSTSDRTCYLHIGFEKTGSTSIQQSLALVSLRESDAGLVVFSSLFPNERQFVALFQDFKTNDDFFDAKGITSDHDLVSWKADVFHQASSAMAHLPFNCKVVISSEHFHSRLNSDLEIRRLKAFLAPHFKRIKVIAYIRKQSEVIESLYSTALRLGHDASFCDFCDQMIIDKDYLDYFTALCRWQNVFGKYDLDVVSYRDATGDRLGLIGDFERRIDQFQGTLKIVDRRNRSLGRVTLSVLGKINRLFPKYRHRKYINGRHYIGNTLRFLVSSLGGAIDISAPYTMTAEVCFRYDAEYFSSNVSLSLAFNLKL